MRRVDFQISPPLVNSEEKRSGRGKFDRTFSCAETSKFLRFRSAYHLDSYPRCLVCTIGFCLNPAIWVFQAPDTTFFQWPGPSLSLRVNGITSSGLTILALSHPISLIFFCSPAVGIGLRHVLSDVLCLEIVGNDDSGKVYVKESALIESSVFTSVSVDCMVQTAIALHVEGLQKRHSRR